MLFFKKNETRPNFEPEGLEGLKLKTGKASLPENVREVIDTEMERLSNTDPAAAEYAIGFNYIEYLLAMPWNVQTPDNMDLARAEAVLDGSHAGLGQVKDRILECLAQRTMFARQAFSILVVDDEPIARNNLRHILSREGYEVEVACNGVDALEKVGRWEFDLIITDLKMDSMDGMTLLKEAQKISPVTKIMIVTGYATVDTAVQAMKTGAVHYLSKPLELDELRSAVRRILQNAGRQYGFRSPVICFVGPPGVGKTSVGMAIAEAMGRKFCRLSLADLRDEAELRGHRRSYVGALPGRIIQSIRAVNVRNPVFMLDEMDKIGQDVKGDPACVLLEMLDPEQNSRFLDRYLDVPFDLSSVMFIATANSTVRLNGPILDRMEVVPFSGYSEAEKQEIAGRFLIPRQLREHGLTHPLPEFTPDALTGIIREHTNEAGVRGLEREIARVCRKIARMCLERNESGFSGAITPDMVRSLLGPPRYSHGKAEGAARVGIATGLVWSEYGGEIITVEATRMPGTGQLILTGSLGEVLKESAQIALSYIRGNSARLGVQPDFFREQDIHIHIPAGGVTKDGPSAGLTIVAALVSLLTNRAVRQDVALSGEISLSGRVLRVSGVREKLLAAVRAGIRKVVLPAENSAEVEAVRASSPDIPPVLHVNDLEPALQSVMPDWE